MKHFNQIFVVACCVFLAGCTTPNSEQIGQQTNPTTQSTPVTQKISGTFEDLLEQGDKVCRFSYSDDKIAANGTVYLHDGQMFNKTDAISDGETMVANSLITGGLLYSWDEKTRQGVKMDYKKAMEMAESLPSSSAGAQTNNMPDVNQEYDYECENWTVEAGKFEVPSNVTFMDLSVQLEQIEQINNQMPSSGTMRTPAAGLNVPISEGMPGQDACNACGFLEGPKQQQCLDVLRC